MMSKAFNAFDKTRLPDPNRQKKSRNDPRYLLNPPSTESTIHLQAIQYRSNIRQEYTGIENLAASIHEKSLLEPVRITKDDYLIFGYRRVKAIEYGYHNIENFDRNLYAAIPCTIDNRLSSDISEEEWEKLQLAENEERQDLDNFDLALLYQRKLDQNWTRKQIQDYFKVSRGFVSNILKLNNLVPELKKLFKEFQEYAWSQEMYTAVYISGFTEKNLAFYENNKGIIGWKTLYSIAKFDDQEEQIKTFLSKFYTRLTQEQLDWEIFSIHAEVYRSLPQAPTLNEKVKKNVKSLERTLEKVKKNVKKIEGKNPQQALEFVDYTITKLQKELENFSQIRTQLNQQKITEIKK